MAAGRYCLDKILPTVIKSEEAPTQTTTEAVLQIRDSLAFLAGLNQGHRSILDSPHVYEGKAALPRAIDLVDVEVATK